MKKKISILKAATLCVALGFIFASSAFVSQHGSIGLVTAFSDKFENTFDSAHTIKIDVKDVSVNIGKSESDEIIVSGYNDKKQYFTVDESDGIISIGFTDARKWHEHILNYTPDGFSSFGSLSIKIPDNSNLNIEATLTDLFFGLYVNEVSIDGAFTVNAQNSSVHVEKFSAEKIKINSNVGGKKPNKGIKLKSTEITGDLDIFTNKAEISIDGLDCANLNIHNKGGEILVSSTMIEKAGIIGADNTYIQLIGSSFGNRVKIKTARQRIVVAALSAPDIEIENDNADILGTVLGIAEEYDINCHCIGICTLPFMRDRENLTKKITVTNTHADIKLVFENSAGG